MYNSFANYFFYTGDTRTNVLVYAQSGLDWHQRLELCLEYEYIRRPISPRLCGLGGLNLDKLGNKMLYKTKKDPFPEEGAFLRLG